MDNRETQRLKGVLDHCLLALIAERLRYGFELMRSLDELALGRIGEGSIYPLLSRLLRAELVETYTFTSPDTGRKRNYYRILPKGQEKLDEWTAEWVDFAGAVDVILGVARS